MKFFNLFLFLSFLYTNTAFAAKIDSLLVEIGCDQRDAAKVAQKRVPVNVRIMDADNQTVLSTHKFDCPLLPNFSKELAKNLEIPNTVKKLEFLVYLGNGKFTNTRVCMVSHFNIPPQTFDVPLNDGASFHSILIKAQLKEFYVDRAYSRFKTQPTVEFRKKLAEPKILKDSDWTWQSNASKLLKQPDGTHKFTTDTAGAYQLMHPFVIPELARSIKIPYKLQVTGSITLSLLDTGVNQFVKQQSFNSGPHTGIMEVMTHGKKKLTLIISNNNIANGVRQVSHVTLKDLQIVFE